MKANKVYLSLGSNIGNKYYYLLSGIFAISNLENTKVTNISKFYSTDPVGYLDQDQFLNCAIEIETKLEPLYLLHKLQQIEIDLKRVRKIKWGPRTLDIDIIFYEDIKSDVEELILPHPRYMERNFVLIPLLDIIVDKDHIRSLVDPTDTSVRLEEKKSILVSTCLLGIDISYDGGNNYNYVVINLLKKLFNLVLACPEVEGGLSTPRVSAERNGNKVVRKDGVEVTEEFNKGGEIALEKAIKNNVILALLKGKSPSCGIDKIYDGNFTRTLISENGIAAEKLLSNKIDIIEVNRDEQ
jgi:2-amino-4-hydroxy-6-hydroxymethyldihydropteridine diphosphokinase